MTTFILAGGNDRLSESYGGQLANVINLLGVQNPNVLSCQFAKDNDLSDVEYDSWRDWFEDNLGTECTVVFANKTDFYNQVSKADIVYLHGGRTENLLSTLPDFDKVKRVFKGKIIVGSSAGANYLSKYMYSPSRKMVLQGSGIVDVSTIVHFYQKNIDGHVRTIEEWNSIREDAHSKSCSQILCLPEGAFAVVSQT